MGKGILFSFRDGGTFGKCGDGFLDIKSIFMVIFKDLRIGLSGIFFPIVLFFDSGIILFSCVLIFFLEFILSFGCVSSVILFGFLKIVLIMLGRIVGRSSISLIVFSLTVMRVLRVLIVNLFGFVAACVRGRKILCTQKVR